MTKHLLKTHTAPGWMCCFIRFFLHPDQASSSYARRQEWAHQQPSVLPSSLHLNIVGIHNLECIILENSTKGGLYVGCRPCHHLKVVLWEMVQGCVCVSFTQKASCSMGLKHSDLSCISRFLHTRAHEIFPTDPPVLALWVAGRKQRQAVQALWEQWKGSVYLWAVPSVNNGNFAGGWILIFSVR